MINERIKKLRVLFKEYNIEGYIIPSWDEFLNEFPPPYARRLEYITGFTGSNGICVILQDHAFFFTDGRYLEQSQKELDLDIFKIFNQKDLINFPWHEFLSNDSNSIKRPPIAYDSRIFTYKMLELFSSLKLRPIENNLIDYIWQDRPSKPLSEIYIYPEEFAGESYKKKIILCREILNKHNASTLILTASDSICWLLNLRAHDIEFSPLILGYLIISKHGIYLFVNPDNINEKIRKERPDVTFYELQNFESFVKGINGKSLIDENIASSFIVDLLKDKQHIEDPCKLFKSCKNNIEIKHSIDGHIKDAVALCEFFAYLSNNPDANLNEYDLGLKLTKLRAQQEDYKMDSFPAICGFKENSAIIHYRANKDNAKKIEENGLLLIDSGGQYLGCTTDITRTIAIGTPSPLEKVYYTKVLKGHIALSKIKFPYDITGSHLDILARQFLWQDCLDYPHSTGHGVGSFLNVHEGPQNISLHSRVKFSPGMILSNEPGIYLPGQFGIRIENLMYVKIVENNSSFLEFETLSLVPYAKELIDFNMLTYEEKDYLAIYYQKILTKVAPLLSPAAKNWLESECANFSNPSSNASINQT